MGMSESKTELIAKDENQVKIAGPGDVVGDLIAMAIDKDLDIDKLERLLEMKEREETKTAKHMFDAAMSRVQAVIEPIIADAENTHTNSRYSKLSKIVGTLSPIYGKEGFSVSFGTGKCDSEILVKDGWRRTTAELSHTGGYSKSYYVDLPADTCGPSGKVNKTLIHASKSTITYARVILMGLMFNFTTTLDVDNDGNTQLYEVITDEQAATIQDYMDALEVDEKAFFKYLRIDKLENLLATDYPKTIKALERKQKAANK